MKTKLNIFVKIKASFRLIEAVRQANKEHASTARPATLSLWIE